MIYRVEVLPTAEQDLFNLTEWIADRTDVDTALAYIDRIERRVARLADFPERGVAKPKFGEGFRTLSFEKRLLIVYRVDKDVVTVHRVISAVMDLHWV